jgi:hypothetical protein
LSQGKLHAFLAECCKSPGNHPLGQYLQCSDIVRVWHFISGVTNQQVNFSFSGVGDSNRANCD